MVQTAQAEKQADRTISDDVARLVEAARSKKARDIAVLDLRGSSDVTDFFVICTADVDSHARAIADGIVESQRIATGRKPWHIEGTDKMNWVLIDYVDVVVHIMRDDTRKFYGLEEIWGDASRTDYPNE
ncbi:MAG TPA: ribosome silencing factor [Firmicutes bacterium]|nr:ribosome silencing factor [Bacillota bacterium]